MDPIHPFVYFNVDGTICSVFCFRLYSSMIYFDMSVSLRRMYSGRLSGVIR